MYRFLVESYHLADEKETCFALQLENIDDFDECKSLVDYFKLFYPAVTDFVTKESHPEYPTGCYMYTAVGQYFGIYFNEDTSLLNSDVGEDESRPVCRREEGRTFSVFFFQTSSFYIYSKPTKLIAYDNHYIIDIRM